MTPAVKIGVGVAAFVVIAGGAAFALGDDDEVQPSNAPGAALSWKGSVGTRDFEVFRNGANWAWKGDGVGSGSEDSVIGSLRSVLRALVETAGPMEVITLVATQGGLDLLRAQVAPLDGRWIWNANPTVKVEGGHGDAPSRGAAVLELLTWIDGHGSAGLEGVSGPGDDEDEEPEVDPDADTVPIDVPPLPDEAPSPTSNLHELRTVDELETWAVAHALDPDGSQGPRASTVVLAYDRGWIGRPQTLDEVRELAVQYPAVHFVLVSFELTREAFGEPRTPLGYVATAVGPDRRARAEQVAGRKKTLGPISVGRLVQLVRFAAHGPAENDERLFDAKAADGTRYVLEVRHVKGGAAWEFLAWKGKLGDDDEAIERQGAPSVDLALKAAMTWMNVRGLSPISVGKSM